MTTTSSTTSSTSAEPTGSTSVSALPPVGSAKPAAGPGRGRVRAEQGAKRVRALLGGALVVDTVRPVLVWEGPHYPVYYLPAEDFRAELVPNGKVARSPSRGDATRHDVVVDGRRAEDAAATYPDSPMPELRGLVRLDWDAMDTWLEEDEIVYGHARNPYHRVDVLSSSRHVRVEIDGVTVAESTRPTVLFETGIRPRFYLPLSDVRTELLRPSDSVTHCPYKGEAGYFSVEVNGTVHKDVIWIYRTPLFESIRIAGLVCFYDEKLDIYVDGVHT
ncbi:DUF427 domain-containing protein [Frankia sp. CNm7]|uniref:DUF427 domain-containing protein n=1 Tax=Frankia nepalensis TaxID=1836974 RepID=A0A937RIJ9_9ACTN|nr:DUF427 domain-containing protein [Frankia nepalensis]MBL7497848.1 DUF427 domain-containing protein [Frankia nepalensis]MBL7509671.1 DUF427 domain-containing protein [Frankia nepalensis]MBL7520964.1 DUF427 domain-containing protein [Frankia nepalensis]MBL7630832.1 DUF427 domain-containing protein [Frankia nepalensis]